MICCCLFCVVCNSQSKSYYSFSGFGQWGWVIPTNGFVKGNNSEHKAISQCYAHSLRLTKHTSGDKPWHSLYDFPSFGIGIFKAAFNVPNQLGEPTALYLFLTKPIFTSGKYTLYGDYSLGVAFNWLHFTAKHPERTAIGAAASCYIDASFLLKREISEHFDFGVGLSISHFSNGAMKKPNHGLNVLSSKITFDYFPKKKKQHHFSSAENFDSHFLDIWTFFAGSHNVLTVFSSEQVNQPYDSRSYFVIGADRRLLKRFNLKHSFGAGIGIGYDQYVGTSYRIFSREPHFYEVNHVERLNFSTYLSYEYRIHRLGLVIEPGIYLYKSELDESPLFFQRIGLRYYANDNIFAAINLRAAKFSVAQYIEWSIGYALPNHKTKKQE